MGLGFDTYLETLIATKLGVSIELKSLTGAALEAFNKLHPRGAEGTRIGGRFVNKVEGMVGEAIHNVVESVPVKPGVRKILAKDVVKRVVEAKPATKKAAGKQLSQYELSLQPGLNLLEKLVDKVVTFLHEGKIEPEHIGTIGKTLKDTYRRTGIKKLNNIFVKSTWTGRAHYLSESSTISPNTRTLYIGPSFPFEDLAGKIRYFEVKLARVQNTIKLAALDIKNKAILPGKTIEQTKKKIMGDIVRYQVEVQEYTGNIKNLKEGKFVREHSVFNVENKYEAMINHELGHQWHHDYNDRVNKHFGIKLKKPEDINFRGIETVVAEKGLLEKYGVTRRAKDNWHECIAENFTLYMAGIKEPLHPDMIKLFDKYIKP
jgi:hypothetical protein